MLINTGYAINPVSETYLASVIPGVLEDFSFFWMLPQIIFNFLWLLILIITRLDVRTNRWMWIGVMMIAITISSIGYGFIIPGFASAHSEVYQDNTPAYVSAAMFAMFQSTLYAITGFFFPLAHIIHNALFILGFAVALSIGGVGITDYMIPVIAFARLTRFKTQNVRRKFRFNKKP